MQRIWRGLDLTEDACSSFGHVSLGSGVIGTMIAGDGPIIIIILYHLLTVYGPARCENLGERASTLLLRDGHVVQNIFATPTTTTFAIGSLFNSEAPSECYRWFMC